MEGRGVPGAGGTHDMTLWRNTGRAAALWRRHPGWLAMVVMAGCAMLLPAEISPSSAYTPPNRPATHPSGPTTMASGQNEMPPTPVSALYNAVSACRPSLPELDRWRIAGVILHQSELHGYDPLFVLAMVQVESTCSPTARSPKGAVGLIQIKPSTARGVAKEAGLPWLGADMLTRPTFNVQLGLRYLKSLEAQFRDPYLAVAAYNLGPARVARMPRKHARQVRYVRDILALYEDLRTQHGIGRS